jgi:hypothetical protein
MPQLVDEIPLLVHEVASEHQLAGPVRVPREWPELAGRTARRATATVMVIV